MTELLLRGDGGFIGSFGSMGAILSIWRLPACLGSRINEFTGINCDHDGEFAHGSKDRDIIYSNFDVDDCEREIKVKGNGHYIFGDVYLLW